MATQLPQINFPKRGELVRDDFVTAQETAQDVLSGDFTTKFNTAANEVETNTQIVSQDALQVSISKTETNKAKDDAISAKNEAVLAKDEIKGYVMPTGATYSPTTIKAIADMAETLNLTGAI